LPAANGADETGNSQALVAAPVQAQQEADPLALSAPVLLLPVELDVAVPVRQFRVRNLLGTRGRRTAGFWRCAVGLERV
jgi:hypothetical protein